MVLTFLETNFEGLSLIQKKPEPYFVSNNIKNNSMSTTAPLGAGTHIIPVILFGIVVIRQHLLLTGQYPQKLLQKMWSLIFNGLLTPEYAR